VFPTKVALPVALSIRKSVSMVKPGFGAAVLTANRSPSGVKRGVEEPVTEISEHAMEAQHPQNGST
jgi:hypothetical protein